jgi:hypothetical protein
MIKKFLSIIFVLNLLLGGNAYAKYIEIVCTPDYEYGPDLKGKDIWFTYGKPKYVFHLDEENSMILKMGIAEHLKKFSIFRGPLNDKDIKTVNKPFEKTISKYTNKSYPQYEFYTDGNLSSNEDVVNAFELIDYGGGQARYSFGFFMEQYRLKPEHTKLVAREMRNESLSEFYRAKEKINEISYKSIGLIKLFGGISGSCDYEFKK